MSERRAVTGAPVELSADALPVSILSVAVRSDVTDFTLIHLLNLVTFVERDELEHGHGLHVANVVNRLEG